MNQTTHDKFSLIYKLLKESVHIPFNQKHFVEKAKLFSLPIFDRILVICTLFKFGMSLFYFIILEKQILNRTIILDFLLTILSFMIMLMKHLTCIKLFSFLQKIDHYIILRLLRVTYLMIFIYEENYTIYYYEKFTFQLNPEFIFSIHVIVFFFESNNFTGALLYLYIMNILSFIYFISWRNFTAFYLPINVVIGMFVLISVVAHNVGRKLAKSELFFSFYERVIYILAKELGINILYENQMIFPRNAKGEKEHEDMNDEVQSVSSMEQEMCFKGIDNNEVDYKRCSVEEFDGFELLYNTKNHVKLRKTSFMNK